MKTITFSLGVCLSAVGSTAAAGMALSRRSSAPPSPSPLAPWIETLRQELVLLRREWIPFTGIHCLTARGRARRRVSCRRDHF